MTTANGLVPGGAATGAETALALYDAGPGALTRAAPSSPNGLDDEFLTEGAGVPSGWSTWDVSSILSAEVDADGLILEGVTPDANRRWAGIFKDAPAGDFTAYVWCGLQNRGQNVVAAGLMVAQDIETNPGTAQLGAVHVARNTWPRVSAGQNYIFGSTSIQTNGDFPMANGGCWLRARVDDSAGDIWWDMSYDGINWNLVWYNAAANTPFSKVGLFVAVDGNNTTRALFRSFRVRGQLDPHEAKVPSATLEAS